MPLPPVVALEIGTSKVTVLVAEMREDEHVMVTGMGEHASIGVRKGEIIDLENAVVGLRSAIGMAEESGRVTIRQVLLAVSGGHIQSVVNRGTVPIEGRDGEVTPDDIDRAMDIARSVRLPPDRNAVHTICQLFSIDEQEHVVRPEGMVGAQLSLDMLVLHGVRTRLQNAVKVVRSVPMDVQDVAFSGLCSALAVLTAEQKKSGVVVIDLGGGTTDYIAYAGSVLAAAGVFGVGGDHVTNDIALAFNIPIARAERLKRDSGCATVGEPGAAQRIALPPEVGFPGKTISQHALHTVINARMDEVLAAIKTRLEGDDVLRQVGAGIVLTGGGAHLRGITRLAERVFGLPCSIGKPRNVSGLATATEGPQYATCCGLAQYGFRILADQDGGTGIGSWLRGLFKK